MILPTDKDYLQTKQIILGKERMNAGFLPLADWIDRTYDVKTVNIIYDIFNNTIPRIQICFEFEKEKQKFLTGDVSYFDKTKQKEIGDKFCELMKMQGLSESSRSLSDPYRNDLYLTDNVFVFYSAFEPVAKLESVYKISTEQREEFIRSFNNSDIWTISMGFSFPTFFLFTEEKMMEYDKPEMKAKWADRFYEFIKQFDEFNYFKRSEIQVFIDNKENFDKNYGGNWYYYYK